MKIDLKPGGKRSESGEGIFWVSGTVVEKVLIQALAFPMQRVWWYFL